MMGSGFLSEAVMENANTKLEAAIEELRVKYEKKRLVEAEAKRKEAEAKEYEEAKKPKETDWAMEDPELEDLRRARMAALKSAAAARKHHVESGHGILHEIREDDFLKEVTSTKSVIVHFFHPEFETCKVMDKHLRIVAAKPVALGTKFLRIDAPKAPFFVNKLRVKVLPSLILFVDGVAVGRIVGFEGLQTLAPTSGLSSNSVAATPAGTDFTTSSLVRLLKATGIFGEKAMEAVDSDDEEEGGVSAVALMASRRAALMADGDE